MAIQLSGSLAITGSLVATSQIVAQTLNVQQVTSSIVYSSGSNIFGNSLANTQIMTGSVSITGSLSVNGSPVVLTNQTSSTMFIQGGNSFGTQALIGTNDTQNLALETSGSIRMFISSSGFVGINNTSPTQRLDVVGAGLFGSHGAGTYSLAISNNDQSNVRFRITNTGTGGQSFSIVGGNPGASNSGLAIYDETNTATRMYISSSGNVGIGTTSPLNKLHIDGSSGIRVSDASNANFRGITFGATTADTTEYSYIKWLPNSGEFRIYANTAGFGGFMSFYSNNSEAMRINSSGNVGIGITSPATKLDVSGSITISGNNTLSFPNSKVSIGTFPTSTGTDSIAIGYAASAEGNSTIAIGYNPRTVNPNPPFTISNNSIAIGYNPYAGGNNSIAIGYSSKTYFNNSINIGDAYFASGSTTWVTGSMGIGTTSPGSALEIKSGTGNTILGLVPNTNTDYAFIKYVNGAGTSYVGTDNSTGAVFGNGAYSMNIYNVGTGPTVLYTNATARLYISGSGNVGIGTTSPQRKLVVAGDTNISGSIVMGGLVDSGGLAAGYIYMLEGQGISWYNSAFNTARGYIQGTSTGNIILIPVGNVGIGTTSPTAKLHIDNAIGSDVIRISDAAGSVRFSIGQEASYQGNYINTRNIDFKLQTYLAGGSGGNIIFQTQNNGTDTVVERMRVTSGGNVGIGTTTPSSKLFVSGSSNVVSVQGSGSVLMSVDGVNGRLFEVTDDLSNSLFSANTIAGLPVIEAFADYTVNIGTYNAASGSTLSVTGSNVRVNGTIVNTNQYKANTFIQLTSSNYATKTFTFTGATSGTFPVTDFSGVPSNAKALLCYGWYHIKGYGLGSNGQGDHATSWFGGDTTNTTYYPWAGGTNPWPGDAATFQPQFYGSMVLMHDGDSSFASSNMLYYGFWDQGIVTVRNDGNINYYCGYGLSGGTHYNALYCVGYWI